MLLAAIFYVFHLGVLFFLQGADSVIFVKGWGEGHTVETITFHPSMRL